MAMKDRIRIMLIEPDVHTREVYREAVSRMPDMELVFDTDQQTLLAALSPYLSQNRVKKLENAMRAAKMARLASAFLGNGGLQMLSGR